jgi:hypothetical protein
MRACIVLTLRTLALAFLVSAAGCGQSFRRPGQNPDADNEPDTILIYSRFVPDKVDIMPLTGFINTDTIRQISIKPYVSLLDSFGSQIKSPGVFRFELYQRAVRSAEPKGRRVVIWQDVDLTDPDVNNEYWRDFLRAYEFDLPFELDLNQSYILQVTCMCPNNRRLTDEFTLKAVE